MEAPARASNSRFGVIMIWWLIIDANDGVWCSWIYRDLFNIIPGLYRLKTHIDIGVKHRSSIDFMMVAHAASWTALNRASNVQPLVTKRSAFVFCCIDLVYCDLAVLSWLAAHCGYSCFNNLNLYYSFYFLKDNELEAQNITELRHKWTSLMIMWLDLVVFTSQSVHVVQESTWYYSYSYFNNIFWFQY